MSSETTAPAPTDVPRLLDPGLPSLLHSFPDAQRRAAAASDALERSLPTVESEEWRYSRIGEVHLDRFVPTIRPTDAAASDPLAEEVPERAATVTVVDGWIVQVAIDPTWAVRGLGIGPSTGTAGRTAAGDENVLDVLHRALAPDAVCIVVPSGLEVTAPVVVLNHHGGRTVGGAPVASFPHVVVDVGANATATVIEYQWSAMGDDGGAPDAGGLSVPFVELTVGAAGRLSYATVQDHAVGHWQIARQTSSVGAQATLSTSFASFGGTYARLRTDTTLAGRGAHGDLLAVYYGDGNQTHDFRTFQHHAAADTTSDLLFKGVVDDHSSSVYTGLIHIHPEGRGSNAHQTNRNIKLSDDAWAWSVPNLEIENSDVRCSHASTVSPIDAEQRFYLHARGVPPTVADRLIVAGFFHDVIGRMPAEIQGVVRRLVAAKLDARPIEVGGRA